MVVVFHHFLLQFAPHLHGRQFPDDAIALTRTPFFALINGSAAVSIFFVLSGFVLTYRALEMRDGSRILTGAFKRWPRLVLLVVLTNFVSGIFLAIGLYGHSGPWEIAQYYRQNFLGPGFLQKFGHGHAWIIILSAVREGLYTTFFFREDLFNANLWTMHYELIGSFVSYALALMMLGTRNFRSSMILGIVCLLVVAFVMSGNGRGFSALVCGVLIARLYLERTRIQSFAASHRIVWPSALVVAGSIAFILCGIDGYSPPRGFYYFLEPLYGPNTEQICHTISAVLILLIVLFHDGTAAVFRHRFARILGRLSFPIYLVHLPILLAVGFYINQWLQGVMPSFQSTAITFVAFMALTLTAAYPLALLDEWWVRKLNVNFRLKPSQ
jgi:peptidoglycan/LPS O-acetylase OafA/YrhL